MSEFTKGPWKLDRRRESLIGVEGKPVRVYGSGLSLAGLPDAESVANAHLIAAAPELYEACLYMHRLIVDMGHGGLAGAILGESALAKAEGRTL